MKIPFSARLIFSNRIFELRRKSSGAPQKGISEMSIKIILEMLQIAWYGIQLTKEIKKFHQWCKKRADDKAPTPNSTTEQDIRPSSSDTTITVEKSEAPPAIQKNDKWLPMMVWRSTLRSPHFARSFLIESILLSEHKSLHP